MANYNSNDFRYILKGSEIYINKGVELTKDIITPEGYLFCDNLLYQIGIGEVPVFEAEQMVKEFTDFKTN